MRNYEVRLEICATVSLPIENGCEDRNCCDSDNEITDREAIENAMMSAISFRLTGPALFAGPVWSRWLVYKSMGGTMLHVVKFSGGAASAVVAAIVAKRHPEKTVLLYHSTATEPADNDRFRAEVAAYIGIPITDISDGRDIWQVFDDERFLGNQRLTSCSKLLKQRPGDAWIREHLPCTVYYGFTPDEQDRADRITVTLEMMGAEAGFPLIDLGISKEECLRRVTDCWGLALPAMYAWADHANCIPCVKGGLAYWGMVYLHARPAWDRAVAEEKKHGQQILKNTRYGTLEQELLHCLRLANKYEKAKEHGRRTMQLFPQPCSECMM